MIDVTDVSKSYGSIRALHEVSFHVEAGEIIGLLGPNGAGKTTMMRVLTGYLQPDGGQMTVDGLDVLTDALEVQKRIGYLPENAPLYPELTTQAYPKMIADLRQVPPADQPARLSEAIRATDLADHLTRPIGQLNKGYRQRVGLAQEVQQESGGKFTFKVINPDDPNSSVTRQNLFDSYGLRPFAVSLFSPDSYYLHLLLRIGDEGQMLYPSLCCHPRH